ncbi:MAG: VanW family protein [Patescibacteria group bacterium]|jgi:vancomycin resistance protein YoaR
MPKSKKKKAVDKKTVKKQKKKSNLPAIFTILVCAVVLLVGALTVYSNQYQQKILPGVKIGNYDLEGLSYIEALDRIEQAIININDDGLIFTYGDTQLVLESSMTSIESGIVYDVFSFDANAMTEEAFLVGRNGTYLNKLTERLSALLFGRDVPVEYYLDTEIVDLMLKEKFSQFETPHVNASLVVNDDSTFSVAKEQPGEVFDYTAITEELIKNIETLQEVTINLELVNDPIEITQAQATIYLSAVERVAQSAPFEINYEGKNWEITNEQFRSWLSLLPDGLSGITIGLDQGQVGSYLDTLREKVDVPVQEGKFRMEAGKVVEFQGSQPGIIIDTEKTVQKITEDIIKNDSSETTLVVETEEPEISIGNVNDLGIKELIGQGTSDFTGSPTNRRSNIQLGAQKLNGVLIEPDEEFSLLKALGSFEASEGWLPELVIKGNRTVPELGGGACQFGTTMFRTALNTGLPITKRQNHSYSVSYYFPIGTDATIYDPAPDFKFINDTGHYILIQTRIDGNIMTFEMWGTKDGRVAEQTTPVLSNYVSPPATKIVETTDLAPGVTKCTEKAHTGVTASFDYKVTYADGEVKEQNFTSKYKPWQEVCLRGVEKIQEAPKTE